MPAKKSYRNEKGGYARSDKGVEWVSRCMNTFMQVMRLHAWNVLMDPNEDAETPGAVAEIATIQGRRHAKMWLADSFWECTEKDQRHALIHELAHLIVDPMWKTALSVEDELGRGTANVWHENLTTNMEYVVDSIADILEPIISEVK